MIGTSRDFRDQTDKNLNFLQSTGLIDAIQSKLRLRTSLSTKNSYV